MNPEEASVRFDEKTEFNLWLKEFKQKFQPAGQLLALSYKPDILDGMEKSLSALSELLQSLPEDSPLRDQLKRGAELIQRSRAQRREGFGGLLVEFVKKLKAQDVPLREFNQHWRIGVLKENPSQWWESGALDLHYNSLAATASSSYCDHPIVFETAVTSLADMDHVLESSLKALTKLRFDAAYLLELFGESMERCCKVTGASLVPVQELFYETASTLVRHKLSRRKGSPSFQEFGKLQFSVLCDQYRTSSSQLPSDKRIHFETGGQSTIQKGNSFTLCGIGTQDQKVFSFVSWGRK